MLSGAIQEPYTGAIVEFRRGPESSKEIQIDHVVALSDAWQKGAQGLTPLLFWKLRCWAIVSTASFGTARR